MKYACSIERNKFVSAGGLKALFVDSKLLLVEVSNARFLSGEARCFPEVGKVLISVSVFGVVGKHSSHVSVMSISSKEVINKRSDAVK